MGFCEWCNRKTDKLHKVQSLGNTYSICGKCYEAHENEVCILCGATIIGNGSIKGMCYGCSQEEYAERQRKEEELASGVAIELLEAYSNGVEFTQKDFEHWLTFGQGNFSPQYLKECRQNWLRNKLIEQGGWSSDIVEANIDIIEGIMAKHVSKVMDRKYLIVYYDGSKSKHRIREFIEHVGNIFLVEKK